MTTNETNRGGRPKIYDWIPLANRVTSPEDIVVIEWGLREHSSRPEWARGCASAVGRVAAGDPTGGVSRNMGYRYRRMLAELPFDPLKPPGGRRRILRELGAQRGSAEFVLLAGGALAGAVALAVFSPSEALRAFVLLAADNTRADGSEAGSGDSGGVVVPLRRLLADGGRECVPGARELHPVARVECAPVEAVAA